MKRSSVVGLVTLVAVALSLIGMVAAEVGMGTESVHEYNSRSLNHPTLDSTQPNLPGKGVFRGSRP